MLPMQRETWLSRKKTNGESAKLTPVPDPEQIKSALVLRQEPPFGSCSHVWMSFWLFAVTFSESLIPFKREMLAFVPAQTVRLLSVCLQKVGGVSNFLGVRGASMYI